MHYEMCLCFLKHNLPPSVELFLISVVSYSVSRDSYCLNDVAVNVSTPCV
jgi:hypothetical protein